MVAELPRRVGRRPAALSPLMRQARRVRKRMPSLPEALGERSGLEGAGDVPDLVRLLVVGDSTAAGVGVTSMRDALPPQLSAILAVRRGCTVAWTVSARTGATASVTAEELVPAAPIEQDIAVVLVGVNDVLKMTPRQTWRASMDRLVDALEKHLRPGGQIVLSGCRTCGSSALSPSRCAPCSPGVAEPWTGRSDRSPSAGKALATWPCRQLPGRNSSPRTASTPTRQRIGRWPPTLPPRSPHTAEKDSELRDLDFMRAR